MAEINSARSQIATRALHTVVGRNRRRRKGLEPSRRVSETAGPRYLSAFRVAVPRTEVTKSCPGCNRPGGFCTHGAPAPGPLPERIGARAHGPCRNFDSAHVPVAQGRAEESASVQDDGSSSVRSRACGREGFTCYRTVKRGVGRYSLQGSRQSRHRSALSPLLPGGFAYCCLMRRPERAGRLPAVGLRRMLCPF